MGQNRYIVLVIGAMMVALVFGVVGGVALDRQILHVAGFAGVPVTGSSSSSEEPNFDLIREAWQTIDRIYVDRSAVKPTELTYGAISGMVDALGDTGHSRFLTPDMVRQENSFTSGELEGIGVEVEIKEQQLVIVSPIDGSPAQRAGLKPGDIIQKVNGEEITGMSLDDILSKIKGPAGTKVTLTILTPETGEVRDVTLERARIPVHSVDWSLVPGSKIAHVRVSAFTKGSAGDLRNALKEIQSQNVEGVVLDLRNNPGGLLQEAVDITSEFLASGEVMKEKDASGNVRPLQVKPGGNATKIPLVVLVNGGSASASEIVAGALQDANRARLVGEKTFGTGTVLNQFNLSDGSALLLATEEWLTPSGRVIWHKGIEPDVVVSLPNGINPLSPIREENMPAGQVPESQDTQLFKALEMLGHTVAAENSQPAVAP